MIWFALNGLYLCMVNFLPGISFQLSIAWWFILLFVTLYTRSKLLWLMWIYISLYISSPIMYNPWSCCSLSSSLCWLNLWWSTCHIFIIFHPVLCRLIWVIHWLRYLSTRLAWTWWPQFWIIRYIWCTSWPIYITMSVVPTISCYLTFIWLLATMSRTSWVSHLLWMLLLVTTHCSHSIKWSVTLCLLLIGLLPTSWSWCLSNCSTTLSSI